MSTSTAFPVSPSPFTFLDVVYKHIEPIALHTFRCLVSRGRGPELEALAVQVSHWYRDCAALCWDFPWPRIVPPLFSCPHTLILPRPLRRLHVPRSQLLQHPTAITRMFAKGHSSTPTY